MTALWIFLGYLVIFLTLVYAGAYYLSDNEERKKLSLNFFVKGGSELPDHKPKEWG